MDELQDQIEQFSLRRFSVRLYSQSASAAHREPALSTWWIDDDATSCGACRTAIWRGSGYATVGEDI